MTVIAIIPARGGSKGLPSKNVRLVGGRTLVARAVMAAVAARLVERVFVSTDDQTIAASARQAGAEIVWRPAEISGDAASSESALLHALDYLEQSEGFVPSAIVFIQCTSPFVTADDIDGTLEEFFRTGADSAFAAVPFHFFVWRRDLAGNPIGVNHDHLGPRQLRQSRPPEYLEAGSVYVMRANAFRRERSRFCGRKALHEVDPSRLLEIDDPTDIERAQALSPLFDARSAAAALPSELGAVVFDFDGVFTDNGVHVDDTGRESVRCDRGDGMGIAALKDRGVPMLILSKETNPVVSRRGEKLGLEVRQGEDNKLLVLQQWMEDKGIAASGLVYVGNDINDLGCLRFAGCAVGPSDSHASIHSDLHIRLAAPGGHGAIRALADLIIRMLDEKRITLASPTLSQTPRSCHSIIQVGETHGLGAGGK